MRNTWAIALHGGAADSWIGDDNSHENLCIFLQEILKTAETALAGGASAITVVTEVVASLEDYPDINAGRGSALNIDGIHELEAGIVDGSTSKYRAVTGLQRTKNPIRLASTLMRRPVPCLIFGTTADDMAAEEGLVIVDNDYFTTDRRRTYWEANISRVRAIIEDHGTAGAVAIDINGDLAAANTTGGLTFKLSGRLGDTAIVGAGIWADRNVAIVCSGSGEAILQTTTAGKIAAYYSAGSSLDDAVRTAILQTGDAFPKSSCGCIAISSEGEISIQSNSRLFTTAAATSQSGTRTANVLAPSILALKHHMFYTDTLMQAGFCKYPTRKYQIIAEVKPNRKGNTFNFVLFERFFLTIRRLASEIQATLGCTGFKFITEGPTKVFLSPFRMITTNNPALSDAEVESHRSWEQCPDGATSSGRTENRAHLCEMKASTTALSLKCFEEELDDNFCLKIWTVRESEGSKLDRAEIHEKHNCSTRDFFNLDPRRFHNVIAAIWSALKILTKRFDTHTDSIAFQSPCVSSAIVIEIRPLETILQHFPSPAPYCGNSQDAPSIECGVIAPDFEELGSLAAVTRERLYDRCTRGNDDCDGSSQNVAVSHTFLAQSRKSQLHQLCFHEIHGFFGINLGYQAIKF
ncbi:hypothetical protein QQS21_010987 [Conoideocrella luteorostrata]|uniref:Uncharacterized protein n=1 Tax=Conoideocrella luteorostrata TaxID=1105319 RepID=A0AAJ0CGQ9_9HYPO|nr:hypothetical protein QQS21_010987 [Conoideocrella luteorostrata]